MYVFMKYPCGLIICIEHILMLKTMKWLFFSLLLSRPMVSNGLSLEMRIMVKAAVENMLLLNRDI